MHVLFVRDLCAYFVCVTLNTERLENLRGEKLNTQANDSESVSDSGCRRLLNQPYRLSRGRRRIPSCVVHHSLEMKHERNTSTPQQATAAASPSSPAFCNLSASCFAWKCTTTATTAAWSDDMDKDLSVFGAASQTLAAAFLLPFWDVAAVLPRN